MPHRAVLSSLLFVSLALVSNAARVAAQPPPIQYAYDELGRLQAVVDQQGNAAIYVYDAVGNMLAIERFDAATLPNVAITALVPDKGTPGTIVSILGKGFGGAGSNAVAFNGVAAPVTQSATNRIVTSVPAGATTGPITVVSPLGSAISAKPFRVVGALAVAPLSVTLGAGGAQPFVARDGGVETTNVLWSVDGVVGGDASVGTISSQGVYVAPATVPVLRTVAVAATSRDDVSVTASAVVTLKPPVPAFLAAAPLGVRVSDPALRTVASSHVGVQHGPDTGVTVVAAPIGAVASPHEGFATSAPLSVNRAPQ